MPQSINSICHRFAGKWKIGPSLGRDFSGIENEDGIAKKNSKPGCFAKGSRMKDVNWIANTTRGTNDYMQCSHLIYLYDQNINFIVARWLGDSSKAFNDAYALTELIQWVWRSRVRKGEPITLYLPSPRMRRLFEEWLKDHLTKQGH